MKTPTLNDDQQLYVLPCAGGYSCLGYDVLERRFTRLASELVANGVYNAEMPAIRGTLERLAQYNALVEIARQFNAKTGWRSKSELCPELIGKEGKRVEVAYPWGKSRFIVGKSGGFIPCHLEIKRRDSVGGCAVCSESIQSVKLV